VGVRHPLVGPVSAVDLYRHTMPVLQPPKAASYIVYRLGDTYYVEDCRTGEVRGFGGNASAAVRYALDVALPGESVFIKGGGLDFDIETAVTLTDVSDVFVFSDGAVLNGKYDGVGKELGIFHLKGTCRNVRFSGLTFKGDTDVTVSPKVEGKWIRGITLGETAADKFHLVAVSGCRFLNVYSAMAGNGTKYNYLFLDNYVENAVAGIDYRNTYGGVARGSVFKDVEDDNVALNGPLEDVRVMYNHFDAENVPAVGVGSAVGMAAEAPQLGQYISIVGNTIRYPSDNGIRMKYAQRQRYVSIVGNIFHDVRGTGSIRSLGHEVAIVGNIIHGGDPGIWVEADAGWHIIAGNRVAAAVTDLKLVTDNFIEFANRGGRTRLKWNFGDTHITGDGVTTKFTVDVAHGLTYDWISADVTTQRPATVRWWVVDKDADGFYETLRIEVTFDTAPAVDEVVRIFWYVNAVKA